MVVKDLTVSKILYSDKLWVKKDFVSWSANVAVLCILYRKVSFTYQITGL